MNKKNLINLFVGLVLTSILTLPTLMILLADARQPSFFPDNAWLWLALLIFLVCGFVMSVIGLICKIHWGYFVWSQTILSYLVLILYLGWHRRQLDYAKFGSDPDAIHNGPPTATWNGFLFFVLMWLVVGLLPLGFMELKKWRKRRRDTTTH
jgi:hypothetical protein